jgi:hypothetical protein
MISFSGGFGYISRDSSSYNSPNWNLITVKVIVTRNDGKYLVTSSQYATSNLTVNSGIDLLSSYKVTNCPDPLANGDVMSLGYTTTNYYSKSQTDSLLANKLGVAVPLNSIT